MEFEDYRNSACNKCGTNPDDWLDDQGRAIEPPPYTVQVSRCLGCAALEESRASVDDKSVSGQLIHRLLRVPRAVAERELAKWQMKRSR